MTIEHKALSDPQLHEPKGISTAVAGDIYVADGNGSGAWTQRTAEAYGNAIIQNNTTGLTLAAASDATLHTSSDFTKVVSLQAGTSLVNLSIANSELSVTQSGIYLVDAYFVFSFSVNTATIGFKYVVNGTTFSQRTSQQYCATNGKKYNASANSIIQLTAGDILSLYAASDKAGDLTINDANVNVVLLKA